MTSPTASPKSSKGARRDHVQIRVSTADNTPAHSRDSSPARSLSSKLFRVTPPESTTFELRSPSLTTRRTTTPTTTPRIPYSSSPRRKAVDGSSAEGTVRRTVRRGASLGRRIIDSLWVSDDSSSIRSHPSTPRPRREDAPSTYRLPALGRFGQIVVFALFLLGIREIVGGERDAKEEELERRPIRLKGRNPFTVIKDLRPSASPLYSTSIPSLEATWTGGNDYDVARGDLEGKGDVTAVLLHWKRTDNLRILVAHLCQYNFIATVKVWNNNPDIVLTPDTFSASQCPPSKLRIHNSPRNLLFLARHLACAGATTPFCFFQDDDWFVPPLRSLYAQFKRDPEGAIVVSTTDEMAIKYRSEWCFFQGPLHTCFAWLGTGAFSSRAHVVNYLEAVSTIDFPRDELAHADNSFATFLNEPPYVLSSGAVVEMKTGKGYSDGKRGNLRNEIYIQKGLQRFVRYLNLTFSSLPPTTPLPTSPVPIDATSYGSTRPPPFPPHPYAHHARAPCVPSDLCFFLTNVASLLPPDATPYPGPNRVKSLSEWETHVGTMGQVEKEWSLRWGYQNAVDGRPTTAYRSLDLAKDGDFIGLGLIKSLDPIWTPSIVLHFILEDAADFLPVLEVQVSSDGYRWVAATPSEAHGKLTFSCTTTNLRSTRPGVSFPKSSLLSPEAALIRQDETSTTRSKAREWWEERKRTRVRLKECRVELSSAIALGGADRPGWTFVRLLVDGMSRGKKAGKAWGVYEIWVKADGVFIHSSVFRRAVPESPLKGFPKPSTPNSDGSGGIASGFSWTQILSPYPSPSSENPPNLSPPTPYSSLWSPPPLAATPDRPKRPTSFFRTSSYRSDRSAQSSSSKGTSKSGADQSHHISVIDNDFGGIISSTSPYLEDSGDEGLAFENLEGTGLKVLIVGAGIGGLSTAVACARQGFNVTLVERSNGRISHGDSILISPAGSKLFFNWGIGKDMHQKSSRNNYWIFNDKSGVEHHREDLGSLSRHYGSPILQGKRSSFIGILGTEALLLGVKFRYDAEVIGYSDSIHRPAIILRGGEILRGDVVVVCDGVKSVSRNLLATPELPPTPRRPSGYSIFRAIVSVGKNFVHDPLCGHLGDGNIRFWLGVDRHVEIWPMNDRQELAFTFTHPDVGAASTLDSSKVTSVSAILDELGDWDPSLHAVLAKFPRALNWTIVEDSVEPRWVSNGGKIVFAGDAVHPLSPASFQAGTQAVEDGATIALCLAQSGASGSNVPLALKVNNASFTRSRVAVTMAIVPWTRRCLAPVHWPNQPCSVRSLSSSSASTQNNMLARTLTRWLSSSSASHHMSYLFPPHILGPRDEYGNLVHPARLGAEDRMAPPPGRPSLQKPSFLRTTSYTSEFSDSTSGSSADSLSQPASSPNLAEPDTPPSETDEHFTAGRRTSWLDGFKASFCEALPREDIALDLAPPSPEPLRVVIIGSGIAGLAAAIACARQGFSVSILERSTILSNFGDSIVIGSNGVLVLKHWGISDDLSAHSTDGKWWIVNDELGREIHREDLAAVAKKYGSPIAQGKRSHFTCALDREARRLGVDFRYDAEVTGYSDSQERPAVMLRGGELVRGDVIVVCDGAKSSARRLMADSETAPLPRQPSGYAIHRSIVSTRPIKDDPVCQHLADGNIHFFLGDNCHAEIWPLDNGNQIAFTLTHLDTNNSSNLDWRSTSTVSKCLTLMKGWDPALLAAVKKFPMTLHWTILEDYVEPSWVSKGRKANRLCWGLSAPSVGELDAISVLSQAYPLTPPTNFISSQPASFQAGTQAIEDGATIGLCLALAKKAGELGRQIYLPPDPIFATPSNPYASKSPAARRTSTSFANFAPLQPDALEVLVVGTGFAGLATSLALAKSGFSVKVVERSSGESPHGDSVIIGSNGALSLWRWGVEDLWDRASRGRWYEFKDQAGNLLHKEDLGASWGKRSHFLGSLGIAARMSGVEIEYNSEVTGYVDGERPAVSLANGRVLHADVIVVCDGINSMSRCLLKDSQPRRPSGYSIHRAVMDSDAIAWDPECSHLLDGNMRTWLGHDAWISVYPLDHSRQVAFTWTHRDLDQTSSMHWSPSASVDISKILHEISGWDPVLQKAIAKFPRALNWTIVEGDVSRDWISPGGKIVFAGDAIHPLIPSSIQGATMSIEDAETLAQCLTLSGGRPEGVQLALEVYEKLRKPRVELAARLGRKVRLLTLDTEGLTDVRSVLTDPLYPIQQATIYQTFTSRNAPVTQSRSSSVTTTTSIGEDSGPGSNSSSFSADPRHLKPLAFALYDYDAVRETQEQWSELVRQLDAGPDSIARERRELDPLDPLDHGEEDKQREWMKERRERRSRRDSLAFNSETFAAFSIRENP
ncbi:hypothetical protein JCM11491_003601 [Sporobolomyces phaffii]